MIGLKPKCSKSSINGTSITEILLIPGLIKDCCPTPQLPGFLSFDYRDIFPVSSHPIMEDLLQKKSSNIHINIFSFRVILQHQYTPKGLVVLLATIHCMDWSYHSFKLMLPVDVDQTMMTWQNDTLPALCQQYTTTTTYFICISSCWSDS